MNEAADNLRDFIRTTVPMKEYQDLLQKLKLPTVSTVRDDLT